jgi:hypothetical protein
MKMVCIYCLFTENIWGGGGVNNELYYICVVFFHFQYIGLALLKYCFDVRIVFFLVPAAKLHFHEQD